TAVTFMPVPAGSQEASGMWGFLAKVTLLPGKHEEMIGILRASAADMPACLSYVVVKDVGEENTIRVTEVWDSVASHDASLSLPALKNAIPRGKALVSNFERIAVTSRCGERAYQQLRHTDVRAPRGPERLRTSIMTDKGAVWCKGPMSDASSSP